MKTYVILWQYLVEFLE